MTKELKQKEGIFYWTKHSLEKLKEYNLSQQRVRRVLYHPTRIEVGIVPETWASMQVSGSKKHPYEIWVMYVIEKSKLQNQKSKVKAVRIISAWKYPGITKPGEPIPIPLDILEEIMNNYG
jgi:hypothetical protein